MKLSLKLDDLAVESFSTSGSRQVPGTVNAHSGYPDCVASGYPNCGDTNQASDCGGALCSWNMCGGPTVAVTCDDTSTMNDLVSQCVTASMAGPTCEAAYGETCGSLCTA